MTYETTIRRVFPHIYRIALAHLDDEEEAALVAQSVTLCVFEANELRGKQGDSTA